MFSFGHEMIAVKLQVRSDAERVAESYWESIACAIKGLMEVRMVGDLVEARQTPQIHCVAYPDDMEETQRRQIQEVMGMDPQTPQEELWESLSPDLRGLF